MIITDGIPQEFEHFFLEKLDECMKEGFSEGESRLLAWESLERLSFQSPETVLGEAVPNITPKITYNGTNFQDVLDDMSNNISQIIRFRIKADDLLRMWGINPSVPEYDRFVNTIEKRFSQETTKRTNILGRRPFA